MTRGKQHFNNTVTILLMCSSSAIDTFQAFGWLTGPAHIQTNVVSMVFARGVPSDRVLTAAISSRHKEIDIKLETFFLKVDESLATRRVDKFL